MQSIHLVFYPSSLSLRAMFHVRPPVLARPSLVRVWCCGGALGASSAAWPSWSVGSLGRGLRGRRGCSTSKIGSLIRRRLCKGTVPDSCLRNGWLELAQMCRRSNEYLPQARVPRKQLFGPLSARTPILKPKS